MNQFHDKLKQGFVQIHHMETAKYVVSSAPHRDLMVICDLFPMQIFVKGLIKLLMLEIHVRLHISLVVCQIFALFAIITYSLNCEMPKGKVFIVLASVSDKILVNFQPLCHNIFYIPIKLYYFVLAHAKGIFISREGPSIGQSKHFIWYIELLSVPGRNLDVISPLL